MTPVYFALNTVILSLIIRNFFHPSTANYIFFIYSVLTANPGTQLIKPTILKNIKKQILLGVIIKSFYS